MQACNFDDTSFTINVCTAGSNCAPASCSPLQSAAYVPALQAGVFDACYSSVGNDYSVVVQCSAEPCCSTSGVVVALAVIFSLAAVGLCAFWAYMDRVIKARQVADAETMRAAVAEAQAKEKLDAEGFANASAKAGGAGGLYASLSGGGGH